MAEAPAALLWQTWQVWEKVAAFGEHERPECCRLVALSRSFLVKFPSQEKLFSVAPSKRFRFSARLRVSVPCSS